MSGVKPGSAWAQFRSRGTEPRVDKSTRITIPRNDRGPSSGMNPFTSFFSLRRSYWAALAAGVGLLLISVGSKVYFWHFAHNSVRAAGTVTAIEVNEDGSSCPIYRYEASDLRTYEVKSGSCHKPAAYRVGDRITVLYDRKDHGDAYIEQEMKSDPI